MSQHDDECDITLYASTPGATGVMCTCPVGDAAADGASGDGADPDDWQPPPPMKITRKVQQRDTGPAPVTLTGSAAAAFYELRAAEADLRAATQRRDAAVAALARAAIG